jgi:uncharacterized damage-inducible protein DinB
MQTTHDPRYPIGRFSPPATITRENRHEWVTAIAVLPRELNEAVRGMSEVELEQPYRDGGWTVRQVIHHVADSHMNAYVRFRLALTEQAPTIKTYDEAAWAELCDAKTAPIESSLQLLTALHARWVALLRSLKQEDMQRTFVHPELGPRTLDWTTGLYAWHGRHHLSHVRMARGLAQQAGV